MPNKLISQKDFAAKLRAEVPELAEFNDSQIVSKVLELRPELTDKIENPLSGDAVASNAQNKAERDSRSLVKQDTWDAHPRIKQFTQSVMNALPGTGSILGGLAATPETMGTGTILGAGLGAGIGRGAMDVGNQLLGLDDTTPMQKAKNIGVDTAITTLAPGVMNAVKAPIQSARIGAGMLSNAENAIMPKGIRSFLKMPWIEDFANGGNKFDPLVRRGGLSNIADDVVGAKPSVPEVPLNTQPKPKILFNQGKYINKETGEEITDAMNQAKTNQVAKPETSLVKQDTNIDAPRLAGFQNTNNGILYTQFDRAGKPVSVEDIKSMFPGRNINVTKFSENVLSPHLQKFRIDVFDQNGRMSSKVAKELEDEMGGTFHDWQKAGENMVDKMNPSSGQAERNLLAIKEAKDSPKPLYGNPFDSDQQVFPRFRGKR